MPNSIVSPVVTVMSEGDRRSGPRKRGEGKLAA